MIKINPLPPLEFLNECFELDSSLEGGLRWKERPRSHFTNDWGHRNTNKRFNGKPAGNKNVNGYWSIALAYNGEVKSYRIQRIIYSLFYNEIVPDNMLVDHIDRNPANNHPSNLRIADHCQNLANKNVYRNNSYGHPGISFDKKKSCWKAEIQIKKKMFFLGHYNTKEECIQVRKEADKIRANNYTLELTIDDFLHLRKPRFLIKQKRLTKNEKVTKSKKGECTKCGNPAWQKNTLCGECFRIKWPSVEEMTSLIWEKTAKDISLLYNVGEDSVTRFCRRNKIPQPSRKYREDQKKLLKLD